MISVQKNKLRVCYHDLIMQFIKMQSKIEMLTYINLSSIVIDSPLEFNLK